MREVDAIARQLVKRRRLQQSAQLSPAVDADTIIAVLIGLDEKNIIFHFLFATQL